MRLKLPKLPTYDEEVQSKILMGIYRLISYSKPKLTIFSIGENKVAVPNDKILCCLCAARNFPDAYVIVLNDRPVTHMELYFCSEVCKDLWLLQNSERIEFKRHEVSDTETSR